MTRTSFEAESPIDGSTLQTSLLSGAADEDAADEEIISQLLSTNNDENEGSSRRRRRCQPFARGRGPCGVLLLVIFIILGVFSSGWASTSSCNVVAINWNEGGVELSITAVGFWSYQHEVEDTRHKNDKPDGGSSSSQIQMKKVCTDYGSNVKKHQEAVMEDFFPSNKTLQVYAILAPSFYFMGIIAMFVFAVEESLNPEVLRSHSLEPIRNCPAKLMTASAISAAIFLLLSAIFQILSVHGLMNNYTNNDQSNSPICNPAYSHCVLGPGGKWAAFAIFSAFVCGLLSCSAAYFVGCRNGRRRFCFGRC